MNNANLLTDYWDGDTYLVSIPVHRLNNNDILNYSVIIRRYQRSLDTGPGFGPSGEGRILPIAFSNYERLVEAIERIKKCNF